MEPDLIGQEKLVELKLYLQALDVPQWSLTSSVRKSTVERGRLRIRSGPAMEPDLIGQEKHSRTGEIKNPIRARNGA